MKQSSLVLGTVLLLSGGLVRADDYGCTVLLCLANPAGPMAVAECVAPIKKLYRDLARGKPFPACAMASAPDAPRSTSWAQHGVSDYDACPSGTTALEAGSYAVQNVAGASFFLGIGDGDYRSGDDASVLDNKICVGNRLGDTLIQLSGGDSGSSPAAGIFDQVVVISPAAQRNYIDVYVDSKFLHRVRW